MQIKHLTDNYEILIRVLHSFLDRSINIMDHLEQESNMLTGSLVD